MDSSSRSEKEVSIPIPSAKDKPTKRAEGKGFTMVGEPQFSAAGAFSRASVEMRPGVSNEDAIRRLNEQRERLKKMSSAERIEELDRETRRDVAGLFERNIKDSGEYSETLIVKPDGKFDIHKRLGDDFVPFIVPMMGDKPEELYRAMQLIQEENPGMKVEFEHDSDGQWLRYKVTEKPSN